MTSEPDIRLGNQPEEILQKAFVAQLRSDLKRRDVFFVLIESFGLDIAVFANPNGRDRNVFFELKAYVGQRKGGVGFGGSKGRGTQVNILYDSVINAHREPDALRRLDCNIRWLLVDGTQSTGTKRYTVFTSREAQEAAMNFVRPGKQNNFRIKSFRRWHSWEDACKICADFVVGI